MLNNLSLEIRECRQHAGECALQAAAQTDPKTKKEFLVMEGCIDAFVPDLHRIAAARTWIGIAGDDDGLSSLPLSSQCVSHYANFWPQKTRTPAGRERSKTSNLKE
jgi:hypothetical protein